MKQFILLLSFLLVSNGFTTRQQRLEQVATQFTGMTQFHGSILVAEQGKSVLVQHMGLAERAFGRKVEAGTRFHIASITKAFTSVLVLQLVQEGRLDLQATVGTYVPSYKGEGRDKVTLHHLLTHSSGIPNCEGETGMDVYQHLLPPAVFVDRHCSGALESAPGERFSYNNGDYLMLAQIMEQVTHKPYLQILKERILEPCGMHDTGLLTHDALVDRLASTYTQDSLGGFHPDVPYYPENYGAAGAMYSTPEDMLKFDQALFGGKLLGADAMKKFLTPHAQYWGAAYGVWVSEMDWKGETVRVTNRQGAIRGANAIWMHVVEKDITVIALSNTDATPLQELTDGLLKEMME